MNNDPLEKIYKMNYDDIHSTVEESNNRNIELIIKDLIIYFNMRLRCYYDSTNPSEKLWEVPTTKMLRFTENAKAYLTFSQIEEMVKRLIVAYGKLGWKLEVAFRDKQKINNEDAYWDFYFTPLKYINNIDANKVNDNEHY